MKKTLIVLADVSGSKQEMGKAHLLRNLYRFVTQLPVIKPEKFAEVEITYFIWADDISKIALQKDGDIPQLTIGSMVNFVILQDFLSLHLKSNQKVNLLLLSDGNVERNDLKQFLSWKDNQSNLHIQVVCVGADADVVKLKKISTANHVYHAENIASAVDNLIDNNDEVLSAPKSIQEVLHVKGVLLNASHEV